MGKTYAWRDYLKKAQEGSNIALKRYSYVSLFGINSLDDLKYSVFANSIDMVSVGTEPSFETIKENILATAKAGGKWLLPFFQQLPWIKNQVGVVSSLWFHWVKDTIVCIDDIEWRGDKLSIRDVLGLVSYLKEQKGCKLVLIMNDEKLEEENTNFRLYFDKVIDVYLKFSPTAEESVRIALPSDSKIDKLLAACCMALGISDIRLIKKIERLVRLIEPILAPYTTG